MFGIGVPELIIIALVFGLLFFGSKKVTDFAHSLGRFTGEFKKGKQDIERELKAGEELAEKPDAGVSKSEPKKDERVYTGIESKNRRL